MNLGELRTNQWGNAVYSGNCKPVEKRQEHIQHTFSDVVSKVGERQSDIGTDKECNDKKTARQYREQAFCQIGANAPENVKQAWLDAADVVGTDGMGISNSGKLDHISQLMVQRLLKGYRGESASNLLGNSVQSAMRAVNEALYALEYPLGPNHAKTAEQARNREKEKLFYQEFIKRLQEL